MVVTACCVLHNICEIHGDTFDDDWLEESHSLRDLEEPCTPTDNSEEVDAQYIRQALGDYVDSNPVVD